MRLLLIILCLFSFAAKAQTDTIVDRPETAAFDTVVAGSDTVSGGFQMQKSGMGAVWRSLAVPGWGQLYVENYWKAPIFLGVSASLIGIVIYNHNLYSDYRDQVNELSPDDIRFSALKSKREFYRDRRDLTGLYLMGVYLVAAVDAYVGAHLYDFTVGDDLSMTVFTNGSDYAALNLTIRF